MGKSIPKFQACLRDELLIVVIFCKILIITWAKVNTREMGRSSDPHRYTFYLCTHAWETLIIHLILSHDILVVFAVLKNHRMDFRCLW